MFAIFEGKMKGSSRPPHHHQSSTTTLGNSGPSVDSPHTAAQAQSAEDQSPWKKNRIMTTNSKTTIHTSSSPSRKHTYSNKATLPARPPRCIIAAHTSRFDDEEVEERKQPISKSAIDTERSNDGGTGTAARWYQKRLKGSKEPHRSYVSRMKEARSSSNAATNDGVDNANEVKWLEDFQNLNYRIG